MVRDNALFVKVTALVLYVPMSVSSSNCVSSMKGGKSCKILFWKTSPACMETRKGIHDYVSTAEIDA